MIDFLSFMLGMVVGVWLTIGCFITGKVARYYGNPDGPPVWVIILFLCSIVMWPITGLILALESKNGDHSLDDDG